MSETDGSCTRLELAAPSSPTAETPLENLVFAELSTTQSPVRRTQLRARLKVNNQRLGFALDKLIAEGRVRKEPQGWMAVR